MNLLQNITLGCHGIPDRCFKINGKHLPFCARCAGASIGHIAAFMNFLLIPLPSLIYALPALVVLLFDWIFQNKLHYYHSNISRFVTGIVGGYGVGLIIWGGVRISWHFIFSS